MKYILTESQYYRLTENKLTNVDFFQDLINKKLKYIRDHCDEMDSEEYGGDIGFESCDEVLSIEQIKVKDIEITQSKHYDGSNIKTLIILNLVIDYNSTKYQSFDNIMWDMKQILKSRTKLPIDIHFEAINLKKNFEF